MSFVSVAIGVGVVGVGLAAAGAVTSYAAAKQNAAATNAEVGVQQQELATQQQQFNLDYQRQQRQLVRQSVMARSQALTTANAQGAQFSSALPGAYGGISGQGGNNQLALNQNKQLGAARFGEENSMLGAYRMAASANTLGALGSGLTSLGGAVISSQGALTRIGGNRG